MLDEKTTDRDREGETPAPGGERRENAPRDHDEIRVTDHAEGSDEEVRDPEERIAELEAMLAAEHDRHLRAAADLDNLRKRTRRDVEEAALRARVETLAEILPVIDALDRAVDMADPDGRAGPVIEGIQIIRRQFLASVGKFGVKPVDSLGKPFDPAVHEAVAQVDQPDAVPGHVVQELRKGYLIGDRLLRAAMVVMARPRAGEPEKESGRKTEENPNG